MKIEHKYYTKEDFCLCPNKRSQLLFSLILLKVGPRPNKLLTIILNLFMKLNQPK